MAEASIDTRDPFVFMACARQVYRFAKDTVPSCSLHIIGGGPAGSGSQPCIFHIPGPTSSNWTPFSYTEDVTMSYSMEVSEPLPAAEGKPEPYRRLRLRAPCMECIDGFVRQAIESHRLDVRIHRTAREEGQLAFFMWNESVGTWEKHRQAPSRSMDSVFLPGNALQECIEDVEHFFANEALYKKLSVNPIRVYMLHGVPGSGKTSSVQVIASVLGYDVACLSFSKGLTDQDIREAVAAVPDRVVICIEDVDALFGRDRRCRDHDVSFAKFLATLDGVDTSHPTAVFLTTNCLDALDPAVRRRIDWSLEFRAASKEQCRQMYTYFFPAQTAIFDTVWTRIAASHHPFSTSVFYKYLLKALHHGNPLHAQAAELFESLARFSSHTPSPTKMYI